MQKCKSFGYSSLVIALALTICGVVAAQSQVPNLLNYQGRLMNASGQPLDGTFNVKMLIYDSPSGGNMLWSEDHFSVQVTGGLFSVLLGSVNTFPPDFFANTSIYLTVSVNGDPEMSPRQQIVSAAYAQQVGSVDQAGGGLILGELAVQEKIRAGQGTTNSGLGATAFGEGNHASGTYSTVAGGNNNDASTDYTTIAGGQNNAAAAALASVGGGSGNQNSGTAATIAGGITNVAQGDYSVIGGGLSNLATDSASAVLSGAYNQVTGNFSVIAGGGGANGTLQNAIENDYAAIGGGSTNRITGFGIGGAIGGGFGNLLNGSYAAVGGGFQNSAGGVWSAISGGTGNSTDSAGAVVAGGSDNHCPAPYGVIGGGVGNDVPGFGSTVAGGGGNSIAGHFSTIGGGGGLDSLAGNHIDSDLATIAGGGRNLIAEFADWSTIGGGQQNYVTPNSPAGTVSGGASNTVVGSYSTISGGYGNYTYGDDATIGGGYMNSALWPYATVAGGSENSAAGSYCTIGGGDNNLVDTLADYATICGGKDNYASGLFSTVLGGTGNRASGVLAIAAGAGAIAENDGCFVWADNTQGSFQSNTDNEFALRPSNGFRVVAANDNRGASVTNSGNGDGFRAFGNVSRGTAWGAIYAYNSGSSPAVSAFAGSGLAAYFGGDVTVTGTVTKSASFTKTDNPINPANQFLQQAHVESSEMVNEYSGNVVTDANGYATVTLPDYAEALDRDFRYQLTVIGDFAQAIVSQEISNGHFTIRTSKPNLKVSWLVTGLRNDAYAQQLNFTAEVAKTGEQLGKFINPQAYGAPESAGIGYQGDEPK
jgi:hypothetical protein